MNKIVLIAIVSVLSFCSLAFAGNNVDIITSANSNESPQVCQFSLSSYTGSVNNAGNTSSFTVGLSCPQTSDVYATVVAVIDKEPVASMVVKVASGKTVSNSVYIKVGAEYVGKRYQLLVQ